MAVTYLTQASSGTPTLTGAAGSLIALLDFCLVTTMGWTKSFSGTNIATYRAPTGNRFYLGVADTTTLNSRLRCFEVATAAGAEASAGTGGTPTDAQLSGGCYLYKSSDTSTARSWWFASNGKMLYLGIKPDDYVDWSLFAFGDISSYKSSDSFNTVIMGEPSATSVQYGIISGVKAAYQGYAGSHIVRGISQTGSSLQVAKIIPSTFGAYDGGVLGAIGVAYPSPVENGLLMARVEVCESGTAIRGYMPGLFAPCHRVPLANETTFTGSGTLAGRSFVARLAGRGQVMVETSDTWGS